MAITIPAPVSISPVFFDNQFQDNNGNPLAGGKIYAYTAGSSTTPQTTFTNASGSIANTNPIVLDSSGRLTTELWLADGYGYHLVLTTSNDILLQAVDNVYGAMPTPVGAGYESVIWTPLLVTPTYVSANIFTVSGDQTQYMVVGNRIRYQFNDLSLAQGTITASTYTGTDTQVTFTPDAIDFNNNVMNVAYSVLVAEKMTVDAAGVCWTPSIAYTGNNIGFKINELNRKVDAYARTWPTTGAPAFYAAMSYVPDVITNFVAKINFTNNSLGVAATLNVANNGAWPLKQIDSNGNYVDPIIKAGMISEVAYARINDADGWLLLNPLPAIPAGTIAFLAMDSVPSGWLAANGASVSVTSYPSLYAAIGNTYGGDTSNFTLPNMQGQFARGYDAGGSVDPGRTFGSTQAGQMESHNHRMVWTWYDGGGGRGLVDPVNPVDITYAGQGGGNASWGVTFSGTGTETRPTNVALLACIKF